MIKRLNSGFSLIEVMSAVVIMALVFAIAMYSYANIRNTSRKIACIANLEKIDAAVDQWALDNYAQVETSLSGSEEDIYNDYVRSGKPKCPSGGEYTLNAVGVKPQVTCSKEDEGHKLP
jgi:prepilin-type N-terminal cleavage/methylation domain-containing protein